MTHKQNKKRPELSESEMLWKIRTHCVTKGYAILMGTIGIRLLGYVDGLKKHGHYFKVFEEKQFKELCGRN